MDASGRRRFRDHLAATARADPDVLGLVFLGSSAETGRQDRWSDEDFFLVTRDGVQTRHRADLGWLPAGFTVSLAFQDTDHGFQVLDTRAHLLEFAVFSEAELDRSARERVHRGGGQGKWNYPNTMDTKMIVEGYRRRQHDDPDTPDKAQDLHQRVQARCLTNQPSLQPG